MRIAFCIPGNTFSGWFLENWTNLIQSLPNTMEYKLFRNYHPVIFDVRDKLTTKAMSYNPDYYMWIDSDINFSPKDFERLFEYDHDIISGLYTFSDAPTMMKEYGEVSFCAHHLSERRWITTEDIVDNDKPMLCRGNGMGWMLVKAKVFDSVKDPFLPDGHRSEDMLFQSRCLDQGFKSYVHPKIILGHEKMVILKGKDVLSH